MGAALGERLGRDGGAALLIDYGRSEPGFGDTLLAKWKTTLQLTALTLELIVAAWGAFSLPDGTPLRDGFEVAAHGLFWLAALVTLITGAQYWEQTRKALV